MIKEDAGAPFRTFAGLIALSSSGDQPETRLIEGPSIAVAPCREPAELTIET